jgi:hypothetical protein
MRQRPRIVSSTAVIGAVLLGGGVALAETAPHHSSTTASTADVQTVPSAGASSTGASTSATADPALVAQLGSSNRELAALRKKVEQARQQVAQALRSAQAAAAEQRQQQADLALRSAESLSQSPSSSRGSQAAATSPYTEPASTMPSSTQPGSTPTSPAPTVHASTGASGSATATSGGGEQGDDHGERGDDGGGDD